MRDPQDLLRCWSLCRCLDAGAQPSAYDGALPGGNVVRDTGAPSAGRCACSATASCTRRAARSLISCLRARRRDSVLSARAVSRGTARSAWTSVGIGGSFLPDTRRTASVCAPRRSTAQGTWLRGLRRTAPAPCRGRMRAQEVVLAEARLQVAFGGISPSRFCTACRGCLTGGHATGPGRTDVPL